MFYWKIQARTGKNLFVTKFYTLQVYVIENGLQLYIWVGQNVTPNDVQSIWGVNSPVEVPDALPKLETEQNSTMNQLMASLATLRGRNLKPIIIRCGHPDAKITESRMRRLMVWFAILSMELAPYRICRTKTVKAPARLPMSTFSFTYTKKSVSYWVN